MKLLRSDSVGAINVLLVPLVVAVLSFFATLGFAYWAYSERNDYKDNSDQKAAAAVEVASQKVASEKDNEFLEREKNPLVDYAGPAQYGSIKVKYPKTWSALITEENTPTYIFNPKYVYGGVDTKQALKITVESQEYNSVIGQFDGQLDQGELTAKAYSLPKVPGVVGIRFDGQIEPGKSASLIILPLRDKTIKIVSESPEYFKDFNNIILPNLVFSP